MKLCTFYSAYSADTARIGAKTDNGIVDITALGFPALMNDVISGGSEMMRDIADAITGAPTIDEAEIRFGNITAPAKIICEGLNYTDHAEETGGTAPELPIFFSKFNDVLTPANAPVALPDWLERYDYEAELVIVVGKHAQNVAEDDAFEHIFGFACGNDLSARDAQFLSTQWISGKNLPGFGPTGPYIVTSDELDPDRDALAIKCFRNGELVQNGNSADMIFSCRKTLASASRFFALAPGDLIFTGTPAGVIQGKPREQRSWLTAGETVSVAIEGIGELVTPLV